MSMLLIHDIVEIDVGDSPIGISSPTATAAAEDRDAERLFGMLPVEQAPRLLSLWRGFEAADGSKGTSAKPDMQARVRSQPRRAEREIPL